MAILGCLLGGLALSDIHAGQTWGLPLAVFDVLVLPFAVVNGAVIFVALTIGGLAVDFFIQPPELPPLAAEGAPVQERLDARNAPLRIKHAHNERLERTQKNIAGMIAIPTCLPSVAMVVASSPPAATRFQVGG